MFWVPIYKQIIESDAFKESQRISVYLSLDSEVNTKDILSEMIRLNKEVIVVIVVHTP